LTLEHDIRVALHERASAHHVEVPPVEDVTSADPYGGRTHRSRRPGAVALVAAALVVALGVVAVGLRGEDTTEQPVAAPVAGDHAAVLDGDTPSVDTLDLPAVAPPAGSPGTLVVLQALDTDGTVVASFGAEPGLSTFDSFALVDGAPVDVAGAAEATSYAAGPTTADMDVLVVSQDDGGRLIVAGRGVDASGLEPLAEAALQATEPDEAWWPEDQYALTWAGTDLNPFTAQRSPERTVSYDLDGERVRVGFRSDLDVDLDGYAWFFPNARSEDLDGRPALVHPAGDGSAVASWIEGGGLVTLMGPEADLEALAARVVLVDQVSWDDVVAATPASQEGLDTTTMPPTTTG
jgi:hypothetical protein